MNYLIVGLVTCVLLLATWLSFKSRPATALRVAATIIVLAFASELAWESSHVCRKPSGAHGMVVR